MSQSELTIQDLVARNKVVAVNHKPFNYLAENKALGIIFPSILILTCVDPRCVPERFLNLQGAEAIVIRNICGHVAPNLNDIVGLDGLGGFHEIMIVHHTDCGALQFTDAKMQDLVRQRAPGTKDVESMSFGAITDVEQSVKDDLAVLKASPLVRKELRENAQGFVYDLKTGLLAAVEAQRD